MARKKMTPGQAAAAAAKMEQTTDKLLNGPCPECKGTGKTRGSKCKLCGGSGKKQTIKVHPIKPR